MLEHGMLGTEQLVERDRERDKEKDRGQLSTNSRFTAVNHGSPPPARITSFRPEDAVSPADYHQHSLPRQNPTLDRVHDRREIPNHVKQEQGAGHPRPDTLSPIQQPYAQPSEHLVSPNQQHGLGKRKRSLDITTCPSPDQGRPRPSSPMRVEPNTTASTQNGGQDHPPSHPHSHSHGNSESLNAAPRHHVWRDAVSGNNTAESHNNMSAQDIQSRAGDSDCPPDMHADMPQQSETGSQINQDGSTNDGTKQTIRKRHFSQRTKTGCQ